MTKTMSEASSLRWDNDPFAMPKGKHYADQSMTMSYTSMRSRGVAPDSPFALKMSKDYSVSYADWLKSNPAP